MGRTSSNSASVISSVSSIKTHRFDPPHETLRHIEPAGHAGVVENFDTFANSIRRDLEPSGPLETLVVDRVALAAWRLHAGTRAEADAMRKSASTPRRSRIRAAATADAAADLDREARRLEEALDLLQKLRDRQSRLAPLDIEPALDEIDFDFPAELSNEWTVVPVIPTADELDNDTGTDGKPEEEKTERWQDRLVFDYNVSASSPVVKGTWVTVAHVVSLIVDGWTWGDILRTHPELSDEDIQVCLAYTVAQDNGETDA